MMGVRIDCYGRFVLLLERTSEGGWLVLQVGDDGKRRLRDDVAVPPHVEERELEGYLDDLLHELGGPGRAVRRILD